MNEIDFKQLMLGKDFINIEDFYSEERVSRWRDFLKIQDEREKSGTVDIKTRLKIIRALFSEMIVGINGAEKVYFHRKSGSQENDYYLLYEVTQKRLTRVVITNPQGSSPILKFEVEEYELNKEALK